ncbi:carbon storage regulator [Legionella nautarum]|uniref:Translational regulator CsrA n=1 Tax=Legionella nautarum TaxID=45070 RepID=A0A0W0X239_9GAMM|nr:carbon storage regulator CsrA [Legionella nautarum]KTD38601.1 carbon storage regulator [Legionella nautarum]
MLLLTRKIGESVIISEEIYCTVVGIKGNQARLAFTAPESVSIHREEIQRRIWREQYEKKEEENSLGNKETVMDCLINRLKGMANATPVTES